MAKTGEIKVNKERRIPEERLRQYAKANNDIKIVGYDPDYLLKKKTKAKKK